MILRGILNILTATLGDNTPDFLSVNTVNNYSSLIIEGIPVIMLRKNKKINPRLHTKRHTNLIIVIITIFNVSPWEGPYIPLNTGDGFVIPETSDLITARDIFRDPAINVISMEELIKGEAVTESGIATVFRATYRGNSVSMKVYHEAVRDMTPTQTSYLTREVKLMSGLTHPNIVVLYGVTLTDEGKLGIVAELAELGSLKSLLPHMHRDMHWVLILRMAQDIATGMSFLHKHNVLHRNLNSSNVLVTKVLQCKVSDMGFACLSPFETTGKLSAGAVEYMAPEVLSRHGYSPKSDVYSFGAVLAELATGVPPYSDLGLSPDEICRGVTGGRLHVLSARGGPSSCLRPIADLISQCTNGNPDLRPDFEEVKVRIECIKNSLGSLQNSY